MSFAEGALRLAGAVPRALGWTPEAFWNATPAELAAIVAPAGQTAPLTRGEFDMLMERERDG